MITLDPIDIAFIVVGIVPFLWLVLCNMCNKCPMCN